jgi:hypothetical protein
MRFGRVKFFLENEFPLCPNFFSCHFGFFFFINADLFETLVPSLVSMTSATIAFYGPMIYTAPYEMLLIRANPLRGQVGGVGPCEMASSR